MTGQDFRDWRVSLGATQEEIAERAGVTRQMIVALEQKSSIKMVNIIEAYGLMIGPITYSVNECIDDLTDKIEQKIGRKCKVKISIELCEEEEHGEQS